MAEALTPCAHISGDTRHKFVDCCRRSSSVRRDCHSGAPRSGEPGIQKAQIGGYWIPALGPSSLGRNDDAIY